MEFVRVARVEDVPQGSVRLVRAGDEEIALAHCDGGFYAVQNACIHLQGPLGHGEMDGCVLTCPWHGWQYDVRTGQNEFDLAIQLRTYDVQVEDGEVRVGVSGGDSLIRRGEYFAAHEELELAWRAAPRAERDFFQGLVHVAVAWYQAGRGRQIGTERQLAKAIRRLTPYAPAHRGLDVDSLLAQLHAALQVAEANRLEHAVRIDLDAVELVEEQQ